MEKTSNDQSFRSYTEYFLHYVADGTGYITDDTPFSKKALVSAIKDGRSAIIHSVGRDTSSFSASMYQTLRCINLKEADIQECPCAPASGCKWLVSEDPIPTPMLIQSITDTMGRKRYDHISWQDGSDIPNKRIVSARKSPYYTIRQKNDKLYLFIWNDQFTPVVSMTAIFEDPIEASYYSLCGEDRPDVRCNPLEVSIHLDKRFKDQLFQRMVSLLLPTKMQAPIDIVNNDNPR